MLQTFSKDLKTIKIFRRKIENALDVRITINDKVIIESKKDDAFSEYRASKVLEALDSGFNITSAILLADEDYMLEKINIKRYARQSRLKTILGRVIGKQGKALKLLSSFTNCKFAIEGYNVSIIGKAEDIETAIASLRKLIGGAPHSKVYAYLERNNALKKEDEDEVI